LPNDLADLVARYLVAGGMAEDPEQGYEFTQAARRLAARVGVVREASGIAAYQTARWAEALSELRAARRLTGRADYLPLMADSERALGRLDRALALIREADGSELELDRATQIEVRIVESGIRRDQGLADAAVIALQVPELNGKRLRPWSARLFYAYGDALLAAGRPEEARDAFARAVAADPDDETDAADRLDELDGFEFEDLADYEDEGEVLDDQDDDAGDDEDDDAEDGALSGPEALTADDEQDDRLEDADGLEDPDDLEGAVEDDVKDDAASSEAGLTDETNDDETEDVDDVDDEDDDSGHAHAAAEPAEPDQPSAEASAGDGPAGQAPEDVTGPQ
jgi:tetratricopeptide (TPR) repeat protein